jgi:hypothetical protein
MYEAIIADHIIGDLVIVLPGCNSPIAIRPRFNGRYSVVGERYMDDLKDAAALFGPLPSGWRVQADSGPTEKQGTFSFLNTETGGLHKDDPRILYSRGQDGKYEEHTADFDKPSSASQRCQTEMNSPALGQQKIKLQDFILE